MTPERRAKRRAEIESLVAPESHADYRLKDIATELLAEMDRYASLENEFRLAVEAASELFQKDGEVAPFRHLLRPGQRMLVEGFKVLASEIERLNASNKVLQEPLATGIAEMGRLTKDKDLLARSLELAEENARLAKVVDQAIGASRLRLTTGRDEIFSEDGRTWAHTASELAAELEARQR